MQRTLQLCGLLALFGCGPPTWKGGIHALLAWSDHGVRVIEVPESSPAARAELRADDRITAIDGKRIAGLSSDRVQTLLSGDVGSVAVLEVLREGQTITLSIERVPYETKGAAR